MFATHVCHLNIREWQRERAQPAQRAAATQTVKPLGGDKSPPDCETFSVARTSTPLRSWASVLAT
jgi:hypothetical protein